MTSDTTFSIETDKYEIEWILAQLGSPASRLYPSSFEGITDDKILRAFDSAQSTLFKKGWVKENADNSVSMDITAAGLVGVLGFAKSAMFIRQFKQRETVPQVFSFYQAEGVFLEVIKELNEKITLTAYQNLGSLNTRLVDILSIKSQASCSGHTLTCDVKEYVDLPYILAGDGDESAVKELLRLGANKQFAGGLICSMTASLRHTNLQVIALGSTQSEAPSLLDQLTIIEGVYGLWCVEPQDNGNKQVLIQSPDAETVKQRLLLLAQRFSAENSS